MEQNNSLSELKVMKEFLLQRLAEAKSLHTDDMSGFEEQTVRGALQCIQELITEE